MLRVMYIQDRYPGLRKIGKSLDYNRMHLSNNHKASSHFLIKQITTVGVGNKTFLKFFYSFIVSEVFCTLNKLYPVVVVSGDWRGSQKLFAELSIAGKLISPSASLSNI